MEYEKIESQEPTTWPKFIKAVHFLIDRHQVVEDAGKLYAFDVVATPEELKNDRG
jgi:hypothetical protein